MVELFKAADKYEVLGLLQECTAAFRELTGAAEVAPLLQVPHPCYHEGFHALLGMPACALPT